MNNIKAIINNMKLTELCRQNKIAPPAIPFGLHLRLSVYFFPEASTRIYGEKTQMYSLLEKMKHHSYHLKLLLCAFLKTAIF